MAGTKRVIIPVRVPEDVAEAIDAARGGVSRSAWVADAITSALEGKPTVKTSKRAQEPGRCPHPRGRVIKGFCYACGKPATI